MGSLTPRPRPRWALTPERGEQKCAKYCNYPQRLQETRWVVSSRHSERKTLIFMLLSLKGSAIFTVIAFPLCSFLMLATLVLLLTLADLVSKLGFFFCAP